MRKHLKIVLVSISEVIPRGKNLNFSKNSQVSKPPNQIPAKTSMDMSTVFKALPRDVFDDILKKYKRQQANKTECMVEYMRETTRQTYAPGNWRPWYEILATNASVEDGDYQDILDRDYDAHLINVLVDLRYTFKPLKEGQSEYEYDEDEESNAYYSDSEYEDLREHDDDYVEDSDDEF